MMAGCVGPVGGGCGHVWRRPDRSAVVPEGSATRDRAGAMVNRLRGRWPAV